MTTHRWPRALPRSYNQQYDRLDSATDWFEIYKINQDTYALLEPNHNEEVFSFLLLGSEKAALIDTGMGIGNILKEVENLTSLPVIVVNTHTHFDHVGGNFLFDRIACFDNSYELKNLKQGFDSDFCKGFMQPGSFQNLPQGFKPHEYKINPSNLTMKLNHLDQLDLGNRILTIHHTPGHSPGSICIEDSKYKILFTGDTYYRGFIFVDLPNSNLQEFVKSVEYLLGLLDGIEMLCPSHNECFAPKEDIVALHQCINKTYDKRLKYEVVNGSRFYQFDFFNLRLPLPD